MSMRLATEGARVGRRTGEPALERLPGVDVGGVADQVYDDLDMIDIHDPWESSGSTRYGYVHVTDRARDMSDEALAPAGQELEGHRRVSMRREETPVLTGILEGLYDREDGSDPESKDWAADAPRDRFHQRRVPPATPGAAGRARRPGREEEGGVSPREGGTRVVGVVTGTHRARGSRGMQEDGGVPARMCREASA